MNTEEDIAGMKHFAWLSEKPVFTEECILIIAQWWNRQKYYEYSLFEIKKLDSPVDNTWYWGICEDNGEEWGDIDDLKADLYFTMPLLHPTPQTGGTDSTVEEEFSKITDENLEQAIKMFDKPKVEEDELWIHIFEFMDEQMDFIYMMDYLKQHFTIQRRKL